jgi:hypothetical protein
MLALLPAAGLDLFGAGSSFVTVLVIVSVVGPVALLLIRRGVPNQGIKDLMGISATFLVLLFVTLLMMVFEHAGG